MKKILVIEDEDYLSRFLELELRHEGYLVDICEDGLAGYNKVLDDDYDLILLDLMLPGLNGLEVCRRIRQRSNVPVIILTAKDDVMDKVTGLDVGANDYLTKPFAIEELLARIRVIFRSAGNINPETGNIKVADCELNPITFQVSRAGLDIALTKKEFLLLYTLMKNKNVVMSRNKLLEDVWNESHHEDSNVVDVFIRYLRSKVDGPFEKKLIHTVRGVGYVVRDE
ncbi:MAG: response regulator transcription factor [Spirochaetales bacterium]|nr:response regulator transcription factor [Spirochaetales bacterium]